jgi:hypothetical protein
MINRIRKVLPAQPNRRGMVMKLCGMLALGVVALTPGQASATFLYAWQTSSGPTLAASFRVPDSAIADGTISAAEMSTTPGFTADSSVGTFVELTGGSALAVDPATGAIVRSTNSVMATNSLDTLLISAIGYFIPTSRVQPRGTGVWRVTHLADSPPIDIAFYGFSNGYAQLLVTSGSDTTFTVEASADLAHWTPILTNVIVGGSSTVTDPAPAVSAVRYYRTAIGTPASLRLAFASLSNGRAQLVVNLTCTVEASADLAHWTPILSNVIVGGGSTLTDPEPAVSTVRFYRTVIRN